MRKLLPVLTALILGVMAIVPIHALAEEDTDTTVRIYVSSCIRRDRRKCGRSRHAL